MTAETRAKWAVRWRHAKQKIKNAAPWIVAGAGYIYGVTGIAKAHIDHREIKDIKRQVNIQGEVIDHNAVAGNLLRERVSNLERQNNVLLAKAMEVTEGKTD